MQSLIWVTTFFFTGINDYVVYCASVFLESLKAGRKTVPKPTIELKCTYCQVNCGSSVRSLVNHFIDNHTMEPPMICVDCRNIFSVDYLAKNRWNHNCT